MIAIHAMPLLLRKVTIVLILQLFLFLVSCQAFVQKNQRLGPDSRRFETANDGIDRAQKIMYNQQSRKREAMRYQIIAAEANEPLARRIEEVRWIIFYFQ